MRRIALALAAFAMLAFGAGQAMAQPHGPQHRGPNPVYRHGYGGNPGHRPHGGRGPYYRHGYPGRGYWYPPVYRYPGPHCPRSGFYYRGPGLSIGIGY
jgi:hypothetical protein